VGLRIAYIDGASLDQAIADVAKSLGIASLEFYYRTFFGSLGAERVYYYDALPTQRAQETDADFARRLAEKERKIADLRMVSRTMVRLGMTRGVAGAQRQQGGRRLSSNGSFETCV
jgi:hypothetical protein